MTAMKPVLEFYIDANIVLLLSFCIWRLAQMAMARGGLRHNYAHQLSLLKVALLATILSPAIAYIAVTLSQNLWPATPITLSDLAVAAYLRGDINIAAADFETYLNTRRRVLEILLGDGAGWLMAALGVLAMGAVWHLAGAIRSVLAVRRILAGGHLWRRTRHTDIYLSDTIAVPFATRSLVRRQVVLPSGLLTRSGDLRISLVHEFQHLRDGDVEWEIAFAFLKPFLFWNPAFFLWRGAFNELRELSCDQSVIVERRIAPRDYANCLLGFCDRRITDQGPKAIQVAFARSTARRRSWHAPAGSRRSTSAPTARRSSCTRWPRWRPGATTPVCGRRNRRSVRRSRPRRAVP